MHSVLVVVVCVFALAYGNEECPEPFDEQDSWLEEDVQLLQMSINVESTKLQREVANDGNMPPARPTVGGDEDEGVREEKRAPKLKNTTDEVLRRFPDLKEQGLALREHAPPRGKAFVEDDEKSLLQTVATSIHDAMWPADYVIPSEGAEMCFYSKLPEDQVYHATGFGWTASKLSSWVMAMMFTISDEAVRQLQEVTGTDLSRPWPCGSSFFTAMYAGGYMLFQQGGEHFELPADEGFLLGKGTARRHALIRWKYVASPDGQTQQDHAAGFHIHLTTNLRPVNVGEAKFALKGGGGKDTLNIPPGEPAWVHYTQSTLPASNQVWLGEGVELLRVKPIGRLGYKVRILEAAGGGAFSRPDWDNYKMCSLPHPSNQLLEEGDFKETFSFTFSEDQKWYDVNEKVLVKHGNSYRVEYWYDTTKETCHTTNGFGPCTSGFDLHFFYKEYPGSNEPFPGFIMDQGPWFMRTPNVDSATASSMLVEWRQDPAHGPKSPKYGCPMGQRLPLGVDAPTGAP